MGTAVLLLISRQEPLRPERRGTPLAIRAHRSCGQRYRQIPVLLPERQRQLAPCPVYSNPTESALPGCHSSTRRVSPSGSARDVRRFQYSAQSHWCRTDHPQGGSHRSNRWWADWLGHRQCCSQDRQSMAPRRIHLLSTARHRFPRFHDRTHPVVESH